MQKIVRFTACFAGLGVALTVAVAQQRILPREATVPLSPLCDNCRVVSDTIYECAHFTSDPSEPSHRGG